MGRNPATGAGVLGGLDQADVQAENQKDYGPDDPQHAEDLTGGGEAGHPAILPARLGVGHAPEDHG